MGYDELNVVQNLVDKSLHLDGESNPIRRCSAGEQPSLSSRSSQRSESSSPQFHRLCTIPNASTTFDDQNRSSGEEPESSAFRKIPSRSASPFLAEMKNGDNGTRKNGKRVVCKMHKFSLYESASRFYLVGADAMDQRFRILKIDRNAEYGELSIAEEEVVHTKKETNQLLNTVDEGNKASGGLKLRSGTCWGLLGFIRFTGEYYMLLITKKSQVAVIGGHYIYQVDGTELVSLTTASGNRFKVDRYPEEARFVSILNNLDLSRSFYFSYSYDITNTLQNNIFRERESLHNGDPMPAKANCNEMFVWNHHLREPTTTMLESLPEWCLPIIHGFVDQATLSIYGRTVYITIIARRSRVFAGARFLKRGCNDLGYVANDVETEQIVSEMLTTSFHAPGPKLYANPNYTSYVQHRGSIPLYWSQDNTGVTPKPDIKLNLVDPFYSAAAMHFDNLFARYGAPVFVLNLVKARERTPRESILLKEYTSAIEYLNQSLPKTDKIIYKAWDMSRASKSRDQDVIGTLESIAEDVLSVTSFFHNGNGQESQVKMQNGIARTNCIDCLDRTNAAQFVIGKLALGYQLHALGIISENTVEYETDAVNLFTHMYHDHGDTIAIQYGGSHLVNTMETYRKINQWTSHSRDMVESFKRYYNNSFLDGQRQEAYNLFLGNYKFTQGQPMLWDLSTDYYLHHADPRAWSGEGRKSYIKWYTREHLLPRHMPVASGLPGSLTPRRPEQFDDYWIEYYRPLAISSFQKIFSLRMNSTLQNIPFKSTQEGKYDLSPFRVRAGTEHEIPEKPRYRKIVTIMDPQEHQSDYGMKSETRALGLAARKTLPRWLHPQPNENYEVQHSILKEAQTESFAIPRTLQSTTTTSGKAFQDKLATTQWTLNEFVTSSLSPSVTASEMDEYGRYISHPLNLPLVVSTEALLTPSLEFLGYIQSVSIEAISNLTSTEDDVAEYAEFLDVRDDPLTVTEADTPKKRYKAYRQWLKGKSLFKQSRLDS